MKHDVMKSSFRPICKYKYFILFVSIDHNSKYKPVLLTLQTHFSLWRYLELATLMNVL